MTTYSRGTRVQASSSMAGDMLADLGAVNLADENQSLLSDFSLESIIDLYPDFIFVIPMGNDTTAATKNLEAQTANPRRFAVTQIALFSFLQKPMANRRQRQQAAWRCNGAGGNA